MFCLICSKHILLNTSPNNLSKSMANQDERGFTKSDMQVMDPRDVNFQATGKIILERSPTVWQKIINFLTFRFSESRWKRSRTRWISIGESTRIRKNEPVWFGWNGISNSTSKFHANKKSSVEITAIYSHPIAFGKNFVKLTVLLKK